MVKPNYFGRKELYRRLNKINNDVGYMDTFEDFGRLKGNLHMNHYDLRQNFN